MEQIIQKLFHLADIEAVAGFDSTVAGQIGQGAMTDHGFIRFFLIVQEQADIFQGISNIAGLQIAGHFFHAQRRRTGFRIRITQVVEDVLPFQQKRKSSFSQRRKSAQAFMKMVISFSLTNSCTTTRTTISASLMNTRSI